MPSISGHATMLAKFSGSPISTQISIVTAPATKSGTSVSNTSVTRRSASHSNRLITISAQIPAWMKARTTTSPDFRIEIGPPIEISYSLKLTIPAKYQTRLPLPLKVSRDYGEYAASYKLEGQTLIAERTLNATIEQIRFAASRARPFDWIRARWSAYDQDESIAAMLDAIQRLTPDA